MIVLMAAVALGVSGIWWGPRAWRRVQELYWQHRCMTYVARPETVVADMGLKNPIPAMKVAEPWGRFLDVRLPGASRSLGTAFVHGRQAVTGARRLVVVEVGRASPDNYRQGTLFINVIRPANLFRTCSDAGRGTAWTKMRIAEGYTRVFAGQSDPIDASHFTIEFEVDGQRRTLDGYLQDDDTVTLEERRAGP